MPSKAVADAVEARLGATWTAADATVLPVFGLDQAGETPGDGSPFLTVQYPVASAQQISIGTPGAQLWREEGVIRFVIAMRSGGGVAQGLQWAAELAALFRGKQFDHVSTYAPTSPILDDRNDDGAYFLLAFVVPYYFDLLA